jgi:hypothetical protein
MPDRLKGCTQLLRFATLTLAGSSPAFASRQVTDELGRTVLVPDQPRRIPNAGRENAMKRIITRAAATATKKKGLNIVNSADGKGTTTAALGGALREGGPWK